MKKPTNLWFLQRMSLFSLEGRTLMRSENLLLEMEKIQAVKQEIEEAVMGRSFLTNHSSQTPTTGCF